MHNSSVTPRSELLAQVSAVSLRHAHSRLEAMLSLCSSVMIGRAARLQC